MKIAYSCVVDRNPKFFRQALNLVHSLIAVGIRPGDIVVNLTPPAGLYAGEFAGLGCTTAETPFFGDGKYCNKVAQLRNAPQDADFVVCCDTDLLFLRNIETDLSRYDGKILGKIVDFDNPPLETLRKVAALFPDLPEIPEALADVNLKPTLAGNFNGGLYVVPGCHLTRFSAAWEREALALLENRDATEILGEFGWHIDQISFCFALNRLQLEFINLPMEFNFPIHYPVPAERTTEPDGIRIVHVHDAVDENGFPDPSKVQNTEIRSLISEATDALRTLFHIDTAREFSRHVTRSQFSFVVGFHRSGTSLLTSGCNAIGFGIGSGAMVAASSDNPKGYFENRRLVQLNEAILRELDSDWDDIFFSFGEDPDRVYRKFGDRLARFFETDFLIHPERNFVLKDPRVMLTYPLWRGALQSLGHTSPRIIFIFRNPLECAESQKARHDAGFSTEGDPFHFFGKDLRETLLLWYVYTVRFLLSLRDERAKIVRYDDLIAHPAETMRSLSAWSGVAPDLKPLEDYATKFHEKGLRHHQKSDMDLMKATAEVPYVRQLFLQLEGLSKTDMDDAEGLRRIGADHREQLADLQQFGFLGRLYAVPKRQWRREIHLRNHR